MEMIMVLQYHSIIKHTSAMQESSLVGQSESSLLPYLITPLGPQSCIHRQLKMTVSYFCPVS